jgi:hypothetical protein
VFRASFRLLGADLTWANSRVRITLTLTATNSQGHSGNKALTVYVNTVPDFYTIFLPLVRR